MSLLAEIRRRLPLLVTGVESADPCTNLLGDGWNLALTCPWSLHLDERHWHWEHPDLDDAAWDLIGRHLTSVEAGTDGPGAVTFHFGDDARIEVTPDTDLDPWAMDLSEIVIVGDRVSPL